MNWLLHTFPDSLKLICQQIPSRPKKINVNKIIVKIFYQIKTKIHNFKVDTQRNKITSAALPPHRLSLKIQLYYCVISTKNKDSTMEPG